MGKRQGVNLGSDQLCDLGRNSPQTLAGHLS